MGSFLTVQIPLNHLFIHSYIFWPANVCERGFLDATGQLERYQMERLAEMGVTREQGWVCEVYFKKKALVMELRGKGWCGSGEKMKCLKVDKRTFLLCVCALQKQVAKGSWGDSSRLGGCSASLGSAGLCLAPWGDSGHWGACGLPAPAELIWPWRWCECERKALQLRAASGSLRRDRGKEA